MAISLDENQQRMVDIRKKAPSDRPQYYSAATGKQTRISEDFEAFLILQGRQRNADTTRWLEQCVDFETRDLDRDSLAAVMLKNEIDDATASKRELGPLISLFERFKTSYSLTGFENVVESGQLLNDMQKPMAEIQALISRLQHRETYGKLAFDNLRTNGVTTEDQKQLNSWFSPLSAY